MCPPSRLSLSPAPGGTAPPTGLGDPAGLLQTGRCRVTAGDQAKPWRGRGAKGVCNRQIFSVEIPAETNPGNIDYFSLEDEKLQELTSDMLAVLRGCTISMIQELNRRKQDAGKYKSYLKRVDAVLTEKGVSLPN